MRIHHKENEVGLFSSILHEHELLNTNKIAEQSDITTEEPTKRFW
jgi:hypothetical protein